MKHACRAFLVLSLLLRTAAGVAQAPPGSDIWLLPVKLDGTEVRVTAAPSNITARPGYDNQPMFTPDGGRVLYTSIRDDQADAYAHNISDGTESRLIATPESEYSPTPLPDGSGFSVVRVEMDGTQRLWAFDWDGDNPRLLLENVQPVGYHAWLDEDRVALFVLAATDDEPHMLQLAQLSSGEARILDTDIGVTLASVPGRPYASYLSAGENWQIRTVAPDGALATVARALPEKPYFAWTPEGVLVASDGSRLMVWDPAAMSWGLAADLAPHNITAITRLMVSPRGDYIAFVVPEPAQADGSPE